MPAALAEKRDEKQEIIFIGTLTPEEQIKEEAELHIRQIFNQTFPGESIGFSLTCAEGKSYISFSEEAAAKLGLSSIPKVETNGPPTCMYADICRYLIDIGKY